MNKACYWPVKGRNSTSGFTLIELLVVVTIIAILAAVAWPIYSTYVIKTRRVAAEGCLSEYANYMERYYTTNLNYKKDGAGTPNTLLLASLSCAGNSQTAMFYRYDLPAASFSVSTYAVTATPVGVQLASDTKCGMLKLDQTGARSANGTDPGSCW